MEKILNNSRNYIKMINFYSNIRWIAPCKNEPLKVRDLWFILKKTLKIKLKSKMEYVFTGSHIFFKSI